MVRLSFASLDSVRTKVAGVSVHLHRSRGQEREVDMQKRLACLVMFSVTIVAATVYDSGKALATESEGYKSTSLAQGRFREIDVTVPFRTAQDQPVTRKPGNYCNRQWNVRRVCPEQYLGAWRQHWLAQASRTKPGCRHSRDSDGL